MKCKQAGSVGTWFSMASHTKVGHFSSESGIWHLERKGPGFKHLPFYFYFYFCGDFIENERLWYCDVLQRSRYADLLTDLGLYRSIGTGSACFFRPDAAGSNHCAL